MNGSLDLQLIGKPRNYRQQRRLNEYDRFEIYAMPEPNSGCWLWMGALTPGGYGVFTIRDTYVRAHRAAYVMFVGPIPAGMHVHHRCENKVCVNPDHLSLATPRENTLASDTPARRNSLTTHCPAGHEYTPENTLNKQRGRGCRECNRLYLASRRERRRG